MKAAGMLFLSRGGVRLTKDGKGEPTLTLMCLDRIANHQVEPWAIFWKGHAAAEFWRANEQKLQPGTAINVTVENMRSHAVGRSIEITARVVSCALVTPAQGAEHG
jgi:hypothetical protein